MYISLCERNCEEGDVPIGLAQGSVLGPLSLLIFVYDPTADTVFHWSTFADNLEIYISHPWVGGYQILAQPQTELKMMSNVSRSWNLDLNQIKCAVIRFDRWRLNE